MEIKIYTEKEEHMGLISDLTNELRHENISKIELNHSDDDYFLYVFFKDNVFLDVINELTEMVGDDNPLINMELRYVMFSVEK